MSKGGPGEILEYGNSPIVTAKLFNFAVGKSYLKEEHKQWLRTRVVPILKAGGSISLIGLTSTTATDSFNMRLSNDRASAVVFFLQTEVKKKFAVVHHIAAGEYAARYAGVKDNVEDGGWRAVFISATPLKQPPPPPPPPPQKFKISYERTTRARFLLEYKVNDRGATAGDGDLAARVADAGNTAVMEAYRKLTRVTRQIPEARSTLSEIWITRDESLSYNLPGSGVDFIYLNVDYIWTGHYKSSGPLLLSWDPRTRPQTGDPIVLRLTVEQAKLWLDNPIKAQERMSYWDFRGKGIPYRDYRNGNF